MRAHKNIPEQLKLSDFTDKSLLILDDDDPLRGRLARAMEKKGFQVKEAKTVAEGLNIVKATPPSFACVDLRLEDGNGLDVVKELSKNNLVFFTGIEKAKFRKPVIPGCVLYLKVNILTNKRHLYKFNGEAFVNNILVATSDFSAMLVDQDKAK